MPRLLSDKKLYDEIRTEEQDYRKKVLSQARNKVNMINEEMKPVDLEDITAENNFQILFEKFGEQVGILSQDAIRTLQKMNMEYAETGTVETTPRRDNEELYKIIRIFRQLQSIYKQKFKEGKVKDSDNEIIRNLFKSSGILKNFKTIKQTYDKMEKYYPVLKELTSTLTDIENSLDSGLFTKVQYPLLEKGILSTKEEEEKGEYALKEKEEIEEEKKQRLKEFKDLVRGESRRLERGVWGNIHKNLAELPSAKVPVVIEKLSEYIGTPEWLSDTPAVRRDKIKEILEENEAPIFGLGMSGGSQTLHPLPDEYPPRRFVPMRLYNHEGEDIYSMRRYES